MDCNVNPKLEKVLKKLLEPDFKIKNEVYLNQLLTHITDQSATSLDRITCLGSKRRSKNGMFHRPDRIFSRSPST
nr:unnamed protein product [Callosobruchus chinensis]